jgi:hypothetical protein
VIDLKNYEWKSDWVKRHRREGRVELLRASIVRRFGTIPTELDDKLRVADELFAAD